MANQGGDGMSSPEIQYQLLEAARKVLLELDNYGSRDIFGRTCLSCRRPKTHYQFLRDAIAAAEAEEASVNHG